MTFIIGFLIGAIVATGGFLIYEKTTQSNLNRPEMMQMENGGQMQPPEKPNGNSIGQFNNSVNG